MHEDLDSFVSVCAKVTLKCNQSSSFETCKRIWRHVLVLIAETCVFAYLGMAIFSFQHIVKPALVIWSIVRIVCLLLPYYSVFLLYTTTYL